MTKKSAQHGIQILNKKVLIHFTSYIEEQIMYILFIGCMIVELEKIVQLRFLGMDPIYDEYFARLFIPWYICIHVNILYWYLPDNDDIT